MHSLVLVRHGKSEWSNQNRFAGWTDVPLSAAGIAQARRAGVALAAKGMAFDICHTSYLQRAEQTRAHLMEGMGHRDIPIERSWRLNERHYGDLQCRNRAKMAMEYGNERVLAWRRSYQARPPALDETDERSPRLDPLYADVEPAELPLSESLEDAALRIVPCWETRIKPQIEAGKRVLVVAHTSSLRGLARLIEGLDDRATAAFKIPTAVPLVYRLGAGLELLDKEFMTAGWASRVRLMVNQHKPSSKVSWV
jgi:2,3-bisphosphoglycerate-dependent phosphoglycerate mutase